jgi:hypothetical protein
MSTRAAKIMTRAVGYAISHFKFSRADQWADRFSFG